MGIFRVIFRGLSYVAAKILYRVKVYGIENLPKDEGCIICGNHIHALDAPVLLAACGNRDIRFMAKEELFKNPFFRLVAKAYRVFPVSRDKKDLEAMKKALEVIKENKILGLYPEGTRNGLERGIKPKNGAVNISIRTGAKIIPFAVNGNFKPFRKVTYTFGEPMDFSGYKENAKDKEVVDILTNELMAKIVELRDKDEKINLSIDKK